MFVVADIHPLFWRMYKGQDRLDYWQTHVLRQPFTISLEEETPLPVPTTVVYRPLQDLVGALLDTGFSLRSLKEPRPDREVEKQYPAPWRYPRFIVLNLTKNQN